MNHALKKKKVMLIFGTRPEAIKLAPVIHELQNNADRFDVKILVTAQHRQMLDQVLKIFEISPDIDLNIMAPEQQLSNLTARLLEKITRILALEEPDIVLVQGDTTSAFVGALAAYYSKIPVAHIEAGLRSFSKFQPFPEEINRKLVSNLSDIHFTPTHGTRENLIRDGIFEGDIFITGNTVIDALFYAVKKGGNLRLSDYLPSVDPFKKIILVTVHRRENWGRPLENICCAIVDLCRQFPDIEFVFSVHLNPKVQRIVHFALNDCAGVRLIRPLDYLPFVNLMKRSYIILTDSGGIQEEAPSLGIPVLVLRDFTERPEGIKAGSVRLIGTEPDAILQQVSALINDAFEYDLMAQANNPYGDGCSAQRITKVLVEMLSYKTPHHFIARNDTQELQNLP